LVIALIVLTLFARDIAATVDGGAYLLSSDDSGRSVLERVFADGGRLPVRVDGGDAIDAIATRGTALWIVTRDAVVMRPAWSKLTALHVGIPSASRGENSRETTVTPLGAHRALVMRPCANAKTRVDDCTEVLTVDIEASTATSRTWPVQLLGAIADDRGGAWMRVEHAAGPDVRAQGTIAYAHASADGTWDLWTFNGMIVPGMMAHPKSEAFPVQLAPAADGFWGVSQHTIWPIDMDGVPHKRLEYDEVEHRGVSDVLGAASSGGELVLLTGIHEACCFTDQEHDDASPVIRWITRTGKERAGEIAPTPGWWRDAHRKGTPPARFSVAAGVAWIAFADLVMMRIPQGPDDTHATWYVVAERGESAGKLDEGSRHFWSLTAGLGYSRAGNDDGFAGGVRIERLRTANRKRPHVGIGGFGEVSSLGGRTNVASGLSFGLMRVGAVASAGASLIQDSTDTYHPQLVFSLFLGKRILRHDAPLEAPVGVRFEMRPRTEALPTTFMVATSLDVLVISAIGLLTAAM
jgi:hypothetical protein